MADAPIIRRMLDLSTAHLPEHLGSDDGISGLDREKDFAEINKIDELLYRRFAADPKEVEGG